MHICGMDFSSLASYWQIKALLMLLSHHKINTSLLILKECPYTASSRDALENTPTSALEISLRWGFCTPRPSRLPSGFALGQSLGPRGAKSPPLGNLLGLGECIFQYIPPLGSVRIQYNCSYNETIQLIRYTCSHICSPTKALVPGVLNTGVSIVKEGSIASHEVD